MPNGAGPENKEEFVKLPPNKDLKINLEQSDQSRQFTRRHLGTRIIEATTSAIGLAASVKLGQEAGKQDPTILQTLLQKLTSSLGKLSLDHPLEKEEMVQIKTLEAHQAQVEAARQKYNNPPTTPTPVKK